MNVTVDDIKEIFQFPVQIKQIKSPSGIPIFMGQREMFSAKFDVLEFNLILLDENDTFDIRALKKQLSRYSESFTKDCAYIITNPTCNQINSFIRNLVPFITTTREIFLPFLGIKLLGLKKKDKNVKTDFMMPVTQLLFLYLFYNMDKKYFTKSEVAKILGYTKTSMTRASDQLMSMDLITQVKYGRQYRMEIKGTSRDFYNKAKEFLISPIYDEFYIDQEELTDDFFKAGATALSEESMLAPPKIPCYAVYKNNEIVKTLKKVDIRWDDVSHPIKIQLWKYSPAFFENNGSVDIVSLLCSFKSNYDERIDIEIENIERDKLFIERLE